MVEASSSSQSSGCRYPLPFVLCSGTCEGGQKGNISNRVDEDRKVETMEMLVPMSDLQVFGEM